MSAVQHHDDYEDALWNNSFYSSLAVISLLSSSNHIVNLKRMVNIPNLILSTLVSAELMAPQDAAMVEKDATLCNRTLLMRISPSMKALESVLNGNTHSTPVSEVILEEEPELDSGDGSVYVDAEGQRAHAHSNLSVQTFHTAKSSDTVASDATRKSDHAQHTHKHSSSISTIGESGYSTNDSTPRLHQPAAFYTVKHTSKDYSPQLTTLTTSFPEKEVDSGETKVSNDGPSELEETLLDEDIRDKAEKSVTQLDRSTLSGQSHKEKCLALKSFPTSSKLDSVLQTPPKPIAKSPAMKEAELNRDPQVLAKPALGTSSKPVQSYFPVKSMLDPPKLDEPFQPKRRSNSVASQPFENGRKLKQEPQSSAFASPRSQIAKMSPRHKSSSDVPTQSPSVSLHKRSNTMSDLAGASKGDPTPTASKRFSFRGMFKIKSKNHSLDKLSGVREDVEPSNPSKITARSFSSPNFGDFAQTNKSEMTKKEGRKSFFGKRKKIEADLTAYRIPNSVNEERTPKPASTQTFSATQVAQKSTSPALLHSEPEIQGEYIPRTPATTYSAATQLTPATADLNPNTIREVDDSDYLPVFDQTVDEDSDQDIDNNDDDHAFDPPKRREDGAFGQELSIEPISPELLRMPLDPEGTSTIFGSPFAVSYSPAISTAPKTPKLVHLSQQLRYSPKKALAPTIDNFIPASQSPKPNDLLLGDTLFPKSLTPQEVESIVSLERSRSMRSIRSNGKRSSFINYNGSDENIVLGGDPILLNAGSIRRSGSILKNSVSSQSLRSEPVQLIDAAMQLHQPEVPDVPKEIIQPITEPEPYFDEENANYHDFIEFTDFIDVENLDFSNSPHFSSENSFSHLSSLPAVTNQDGELSSDKMQPAGGLPLPRSQTGISDVLAAESDIFNDGDLVPPLSEENILRKPVPEVVIVDSESSLVVETSQIPPRIHETTGAQNPLKSPILDTAYKMAMNEVVARESPSTAARPMSMSFKGFSGSAFKNQPLIQSGSHQLVHLYSDSANESSAVGKGFGSSDDEDESDDCSFDERENTNQAIASHRSSPSTSPGLKENGSLANRRQSLEQPLEQPQSQPPNNFLSLHPPPSLSGPFYHDRIPSLSDHSAASSPRLLTSFISRMKKSPLESPKVSYIAKSGVRFSSRIVLYDTYNGDEYDRHPDIATCNQLTPLLAQQIKEELNEFKSEMQIHRESQCYTHFF